MPRLTIRKLFSFLAINFIFMSVSKATEPQDPCGSKSQSKQVLECFLKLDFQGLRLKGETSQKAYELTSWEETPGWDAVIMIKQYVVKNQPCKEAKTNTECFNVSFSEYGPVYSDFKGNRVSQKPKTNDLYFVLERKNSDWSISQPEAYAPRVGVSYVRKHVQELIDTETIKSYLNNALQLIEATKNL